MPAWLQFTLLAVICAAPVLLLLDATQARWRGWKRHIDTRMAALPPEWRVDDLPEVSETEEDAA